MSEQREDLLVLTKEPTIIATDRQDATSRVAVFKNWGDEPVVIDPRSGGAQSRDGDVHFVVE